MCVIGRSSTLTYALSTYRTTSASPAVRPGCRLVHHRDARLGKGFVFAVVQRDRPGGSGQRESASAAEALLAGKAEAPPQTAVEHPIDQQFENMVA